VELLSQAILPRRRRLLELKQIKVPLGDTARQKDIVCGYPNVPCAYAGHRHLALHNLRKASFRSSFASCREQALDDIHVIVGSVPAGGEIGL
jgi:hypothetical protein